VGNNSGCHFAAVRAGTKSRVIDFAELPGPPAAIPIDTLTSGLDELPEPRQPVILVFPDLASVTDLAQLVQRFATADRWSVVPTEGRRPGQYDVLVKWKTREGQISHALGLAPSFEMPITRRAPITAMAFWVGGHNNGLLKVPASKPISLADSAHKLPELKYWRLWNDSVASTREYLKESAVPLRDVTFCLPLSTRALVPGSPLGDQASQPQPAAQ
jgi:hypothetical protein